MARPPSQPVAEPTLPDARRPLKLSVFLACSSSAHTLRHTEAGQTRVFVFGDASPSLPVGPRCGLLLHVAHFA